MKKRAIPLTVLLLFLTAVMSSSVFAASSTTATVPVTLTVSNEFRAVNVTVPASLPIYVINGTVAVADNAKITNNSKTGSVQVTGLSVTDGAYKVGDYENFSGSKTIALKINGCATKGSGSEMQKIALARALYKDAPFVILDEPTAALDPIAEAAVYENFNTLTQNKTSVFISHRLSSCRFCDEIAVFDHGQIVQTGGHEELLAEAGGKYAELWNAQAQYYER